jgi:hypothetical protein
MSTIIIFLMFFYYSKPNICHISARSLTSFIPTGAAQAAEIFSKKMSGK